MRLIGVIDLAGGLAVHARGGSRAHYVPAETVAGLEIRGNPITLARTYVERLGLDELYAADLDAIATATPAGARRGARAGRSTLGVHDTIVEGLTTIAPLWLDAAISTPDHARHALHLGARWVVVGLETLRSFDALSAICTAVGEERVAFSLDLRGGVPIAPQLDTPSDEPAHLAAHASDVGVGHVIVLDLARVGAAVGPDLQLMARVRAAAPATTLIAGGGIRGFDDLARLADAGCDGALAATALHDGRLGADDVRRLKDAGRSA
jgi:phosphoribosylformimino-5-aminoimidazole carboxamide ribotide isomerase